MDEVASLHQTDFTGIRVGMVIAMFGALMAMPLGATNAYLISRIEGFFGPLSILQVMGAVGMAVLTFYPPMWWLIASFRPERSAELTQMLNDAAWLQWVGGLTIYYPTILTIAVAAFLDKSPRPYYPRWFAFANLWVAVLLLPGQLIFFFKHGPFAWNGLISFYLAFTVFALWFPVAFVVMRRAVRVVEGTQQQGAQKPAESQRPVSAT